MTQNIGVVVLAAGKGTRLKLEIPKVLLPICGRPMVNFVLDQTQLFAQKNKITPLYAVVVGHGKKEVELNVREYFKGKKDKISFPVQDQQLGTGHAVSSYFSQVPAAHDCEWTLVLCGDAPLIVHEELSELLQLVQKKKLDAALATFSTPEPQGYGRIVKKNKSKIKIVEEKNASAQEKKIQEVNSGLYIFKTSFLVAALKKIKKNELSGEYYLTDVLEMAKKSEARCFSYPEHFLGINDLSQWEVASHLLQRRKILSLQREGVLFQNSSTVSVDWDVEIAPGSKISAGVVLEGHTKIGAQVEIGPGSVLKNTKVAAQAKIKPYSCLEDSLVGQGASIGPFAHLRPGSEIGANAKVGNFVETKKAKLHSGVKVSHLSYVGDAEIGEETNIGCGFITCNYDGEKKHFTKIGARTFVGSDCQAIAPIEIGSDAFVAAGSTLTHDIPDGALALARSKQVNKEGRAKMFLPQKKQK